MSTNDSTHNRRFSLLPRLHGARDFMKPGRHCVTNVLPQWVSVCVYNCNVYVNFLKQLRHINISRCAVITKMPYLWFIVIFAPWMACMEAIFWLICEKFRF